VLIEVDCGDRRSGVDPADAGLLVEIGRTLKLGGATLRGVMVHAGLSYDSRNAAEIVAVAERELHVALKSAAALRSSGLSCEVVSVGSSPTALSARDLSGVTEVRAGVFVFFDLVMAGLGVCDISDIALSVLCTVIGRRSEELLVDAGWMAMSRDRGTAAQAVDQGYGVVCDCAGHPYRDVLMLRADQEHGIVGSRPGSDAALPDVSVGDRVRILPNHACATAAQHDAYNLLSNDGLAVTAVWPRIRGW
jgi:D-serine deaminase-like pyridoxal phosphate-dependent protein